MLIQCSVETGASIIANYTELTPNKITLISFIFSILSFIFFEQGDPCSLIVGGFLFEISYIFDCIDGTIARLKNNGTYLGELWDHLLDRIKDNGLFFALTFGQYKITGEIEWFYYGFGAIFGYSLYYTRVIVYDLIELKYINKLQTSKDELRNQKIQTLFHDGKSDNIFKKWLSYAFKNNINPNPAGPETEALIFFIAPLLNYFFGHLAIKICIILGIMNLLIISSIRTYFTAKTMKNISDMII
jgi:phosphatidylglycerophosphate synthase